LLYLFETQKLLLTQFDVEVHDNHLSASCRGEVMDVARHEMDHEVKAITYHGLQLDQTAIGWRAEVIVDI
jgi:SHS2 domain-containing protein